MSLHFPLTCHSYDKFLYNTKISVLIRPHEASFLYSGYSYCIDKTKRHLYPQKSVSVQALYHLVIFKTVLLFLFTRPFSYDEVRLGLENPQLSRHEQKPIKQLSLQEITYRFLLRPFPVNSHSRANHLTVVTSPCQLSELPQEKEACARKLHLERIAGSNETNI